MRTPVTTVSIQRHDGGQVQDADDLLVTEEPLEIRVGHGPLDQRMETRVSVTMRTPGHDEELALGFLFTEGLITTAADVLRVAPCENVKAEERGNVVRAELHPSVVLDPARWQRNFYTTSSCGVCGKSSIDAVHVACSAPAASFGPVATELITALPERMRAAQTLFKHTGGIHAAALFHRQGELVLLREDVGRHNAVDKVIGAVLRDQHTPPHLSFKDHLLLVSGRAGFELVQKCAVAGIACMAAVGAPSSLAVQLARSRGITLIGFLRGDRFNHYSPEGKE